MFLLVNFFVDYEFSSIPTEAMVDLSMRGRRKKIIKYENKTDTLILDSSLSIYINASTHRAYMRRRGVLLTVIGRTNIRCEKMRC